MARFYVDTSALFKLYRAEPNSAAVLACVSQQDTIVIAHTTPLEVRSAAYRLVRDGRVTRADAAAIVAAFESDLPSYVVVEPSSRVIGTASALLDAHGVTNGLRSLDALQLACALEAHATAPLDALLSTDVVLATVATMHGLTVKP